MKIETTLKVILKIKTMNAKLLIFTLFLITLTSFQDKKEKIKPPFLKPEYKTWADSVMQTMTLDEKIGQLFMVAAYSNKNQEHVNEINKLIEEYKIGGLIFMQGGPYRQANLTNLYQSKSKIPLMIAMDAEWGLSMRLDSTIKFPKQMTMGAVQNDGLIYEMGMELARQCRRIGVHVNFAPDIDVNNNGNNPVIGFRSFGENKYFVTTKGMSYARGMQDHLVLACGKHFPGHGDTDTDSHYDLPIINHDKNRLNDIELFSFTKAIEQGIGSIMVAHLYIPALDTTKNRPSTLSPNIIQKLLKDSLGFEGLVFTDALNMKGIAKFFKPGEIEVLAIKAGNDVLLFPENVPLSLQKIKEAITNKELSEEQIDNACRKILMSKKWLKVDESNKIEIKNLYEDLNTERAKSIKNNISKDAITLLKNKDSIIPIKKLDKIKIASLNVGFDSESAFQKTLSKYADVKHFSIDKKAKTEILNQKIESIKEFDVVIINLVNLNNNPKQNFGMPDYFDELLEKVEKGGSKIILNISGNAYLLSKINNLKKCDAVLVSYEEEWEFLNNAAQTIFGGIQAKGKLPISAGKFEAGDGLTSMKTRLGYAYPEDLGYNSVGLKIIDSLLLGAIDKGAMPGCQILIAKKGNVVFEKSYGYFDYEKKKEVDNQTLFDIASITKIAASVPSLMHLTEKKKFNLDKNLGDYLNCLKGTNKENLCIRDVLAHQSGLLEWISYHAETKNKKVLKPEYYSSEPKKGYSTQVSESLYILDSFSDSIYKKINNSKLFEKKEYKYSDLGYYYFKKIIEEKTDKKLDEFTNDKFYGPLGMNYTLFNPLKKFDKEKISPTENDLTFRGTLLQGYVHDQGAALLGGVAGHAGLFSNVNDLAKLMQLYLNKGTYGGERYFKPETVEEFTRCQFCDESGNRRGAGFDRPQQIGEVGPASDLVGRNSFGHSGFTGTIAWADPENDIIIVFLSNRINPDANNKKLVEMGIRTKIQDLAYQIFRN